jgi:predicted homoserine dehydrogenase-like protein
MLYDFVTPVSAELVRFDKSRDVQANAYSNPDTSGLFADSNEMDDCAGEHNQ